MGILKSWFGEKKPASLEDGNARLIKAMEQIAARDTPENRKALYDALLQSVLLVPVPEIPREMKPGEHVLKAKAQIQLRVTTDNNGMHVTPAFTDAEAVRNFDPNTPFIGFKGIDLFRMLARRSAAGRAAQSLRSHPENDPPGGKNQTRRNRGSSPRSDPHRASAISDQEGREGHDRDASESSDRGGAGFASPSGVELSRGQRALLLSDGEGTRPEQHGDRDSIGPRNFRRRASRNHTISGQHDPTGNEGRSIS